ncbi:MAG: TlpA disulfide reductase family protein [Bacteroidota bacterium]|nr:TlpA disulfide reductase family protein [Bacteroidota bacterium]
MIKKIVLGLLSAISISSFAQNSFTINGTMSGSAEKKIYFTVQEGRSAKTDSVDLQNGKFTLTGQVNDLAAVFILSNKTRGYDNRMIYVEKNDKLTFSGDIKSLYKAKVTGSVLNEEYNKFIENTVDANPIRIAAMEKYIGLKRTGDRDPAKMKEVENKMEQYDKKMTAEAEKFIRNNTNSKLDLLLLRDYFMYSDSKLEELFKLLNPALKTNSSFANAIETQIKLTSISKIGIMAPDFTLNTPEGKPFTLSSLRGKFVLIDFWASWCSPCRGENPNVVKAYQTFKDKNFTILGVSLDSNKSNWIKAIEDDHLAWDHVSDLQGWKNAVAVLYGIYSIPSNILLDKNGKIIAKNLRGENLIKTLNELIK